MVGFDSYYLFHFAFVWKSVALIKKTFQKNFKLFFKRRGKTPFMTKIMCVKRVNEN